MMRGAAVGDKASPGILLSDCTTGGCQLIVVLWINNELVWITRRDTITNDSGSAPSSAK